jgi:hypothetical protein
MAGAHQIVRALAGLGPQGVLALSEILTNTPPAPPSEPAREADIRGHAISQLAGMGTDALPALPALAQCLGDEDGEFAERAKTILKSIISRVVSGSLSRFDESPGDVTPALQTLLTSPSPEVRKETTNAILHLTPK